MAALINLGLLPLAGWLGAQWLRADLAGGLIVAAAVPSTLSSAAVMTRKAGGDDSVSIFVTLLTNISCVVVTPLWIVLLLGVEVDLSLPDMVTNLLLVVLLPILRWSSWLAGDRCDSVAGRSDPGAGWPSAAKWDLVDGSAAGSGSNGDPLEGSERRLAPSGSLPGEGWQVPLVIAMGMTMHWRAGAELAVGALDGCASAPTRGRLFLGQSKNADDRAESGDPVRCQYPADGDLPRLSVADRRANCRTVG